MALDVILENPHIIWFATPDEKVAHVSALTRAPARSDASLEGATGGR